jgi:hypothetical protein
MPFTEISKRLVLRYEQGTFSFRRFAQGAPNELIGDLANEFIALQLGTPKEKLIVVRSEIM